MILSNKRKNSLYGVIIKTHNIDACRAFYRDILGLGAPVIDSNFWVEFKLQEDVALVLEKIPEGEPVSAEHGNTSWMLRLENLETVISRLKEHGYEPLKTDCERLGIKVNAFKDPEGNIFYLYSDKENK